MNLERIVPQRLQVFPDYQADPVWNADGASVTLESLPISAQLCVALRLWRQRWEELMGVSRSRYAIVDEDAHRQWLIEGHALTRRLQAELGAGFQVSFEP